MSSATAIAPNGSPVSVPPAAVVSPTGMTPKKWLALMGGIVGAFMAILDIQITNASLRDVTGGLGATSDEGAWVSTAYLAAEIVVIPLSGWLASVLSIRRYLLWTSIAFLFFSVCCALAWNLESMIIFRALQGFTGGALIPLSFTIILGLPADKRPIGMTLFALTATFAPAIGPTLGGYLTDNFGWPTIFLMNIVPGMFLLFAISRGLDAQPKNLDLLKSFDVYGILTMATGLACLTVFLEEGDRKDWFGSHMIVWLSVIAALSLIAFIVIELTTRKPFVEIRLIGERNFGLSCLINFVVGMSMYGAIYLLPQYLATVQQYNAVSIGKTLMWAGLPQLVVLPFIPRILRTMDARKAVLVGMVLFGASCFLNSEMTSLTGYDQLKYSQIIRALGQPLIIMPLSGIATALILPHQAGSASGLFNMMRNLGGSVGIACLSTLLTNREKFHSARLGEGVNLYHLETQTRITAYIHHFQLQGFNVVSAHNRAIAILDAVLRRQATVMAYNDCFLFLALALWVSGSLVLLCKRVEIGGGGGGR